ncbi:transporter substrate-binding domain-containing protein [Clostridioides difficile]|uniref:transporter substrate-binding domain-containing protein n=1 Tax=Clostridioides difficile TaxID=1496 RepID=UPI00097FFFEF|nr:transporter substrate-binding domain-containing protein [Clostridioides difficile]EKS6834547.1 transporter substrate-binding domain-containing protein [Clostridioides difficile]EKS6837823.1 transporter substrate-binding domain-containing protein [Clostridioides difficile]MCO5816922.1 transporter substrate-binding domain-containing protein [Clostridioides difficile]MDE3649335.1 transporter substrate-binding domain-containing protein [Clostridioides difficile]MDK3370112.1 transporter substrat
MKKLKLIIMFALVSALLVTGCLSGNNKNKEEQKVIRVATSGTYYPFAFKDKDKLKGFEVDFWDEFAKRTNCKVEWVLTDFSGLFGLLEADKADAVSAQLTATPEREKKYAFSDAYNYSGTNIIVREDDTSIKSIDDLVGKKVGVGTGAVANEILKEKYPNDEIKIVNYSSATLKGNYQDLEMGRLDAVVAQDVEALIAIKEQKLNLKMIEPPIQFGACSFALQKNEKGEKWTKEINEVIEEMYKDGTLTKISENWLGKDITKEPINE